MEENQEAPWWANISKQILYRPVLQEDVPDYPEFYDRSEEATAARAWWREQYRRCQYGWTAPDGHYLNPITYFGINFCQVEVEYSDTDGAVMARPLYRENDESILSLIWNGRPRVLKFGEKTVKVDAQGVIEVKGRRIGWTTQINEVYYPWRLVFRPDRAVGRIYPDDENMGDERRQLKQAYENLHPAFKLKQTKDGLRNIEWITDNKDVLMLGYFDYDPQTGKKLGKGTPYMKAACYFGLASPNNRYGPFRGKKLGVVDFVEAGKWTKLKKAMGATVDCLRAGGHYFGQFIIGGTSDAINIESTDYKDVYDNADIYNCNRHFSTGANYLFFDEFSGTSDIEKGTKTLIDRRNRFIAAGDPESANLTRQENPLTPEEAFIPQSENVYPDHKINAQLEWIFQNDIPKTKILRGNLEWVLGPDRKPVLPRRVKFVASDPKSDKPGPFQMLSGFEPEPELRPYYVAGIDDVFKEGIPDPKNSKSKNAFVVWLRDTYKSDVAGLPIFMYNERHPSNYRTYEDFLKIMIFFGHRQVIYEYHPGQNGFIDYLKKMGKIDSAAGSGSKNQYYDMLYKTGGDIGLGSVQTAMITEMTLYGEEWFEQDNHLKVHFAEIMMGFKNWRKKNDDVASATHLIFAYMDRVSTQEAIRARQYNESSSAMVEFHFGQKSSQSTTIPVGTGSTKGWGGFKFGG